LNSKVEDKRFCTENYTTRMLKVFCHEEDTTEWGIWRKNSGWRKSTVQGRILKCIKKYMHTGILQVHFLYRNICYV
jgi:hypothetical protein